MAVDRTYIIPFVGLKLGFHDFQYDIRNEFFEALDYSIIHQGELNVQLELEKKETMLIANFSVNGKVNVSCDRCNGPLDVTIKGDLRLIYTFGASDSDDESLVVLHPDAYEINVHDAIYELCTISLPIRMVHSLGECDEEMLEALSKYTVNFSLEEDEEDDLADEWWDEEEE